MQRREFLKTVGLGALAMGVGFNAAASAPKQPNVLFIALDDMNDWIGALGGPAKTPNIDRLASQGVLFTNAHCVVPLCNASRTALFTGQRPETTGQFQNYGGFRWRPGGEERVTLPQHLKNHGYKTAAAGKLFHHPRGAQEEPSPLSDPQSWDEQYKGWGGTPGNKMYQDEEGLAKWHNKQFTGYRGEACFWGPIPYTKEECGDWKLAEYCADYLNQAHDKPFFLAMGTIRPHSPQTAPQKYFDMYPIDEVELPEIPEDDFDDIPKVAQAKGDYFSDLFTQGIRPKGEWRKAVQAYLACATFVDDCVGHVMEALENSPYRDNTIVVFWTDHGWLLGHKLGWEKFRLWRQSTHTPLIIKAPGVTKPGQRCDRAVSFLDLYPTVSELCHLPIRPELEGHSLVPLLKHPKRRWKYPAVITHGTFPDYAIEYENWNYILRRDGSEELYDHDKDINEFTNLAGNPKYDHVKKKLKKWVPTPEKYPAWRTHVEEREREKNMPFAMK